MTFRLELQGLLKMGQSFIVAACGIEGITLTL
jgi:hypothetical protein